MPANRQKIPPAAHESIERRLRGGESGRSIAEDYGAARITIYKIASLVRRRIGQPSRWAADVEGVRRCRVCLQEKPIADFKGVTRLGRYRRWECRDCFADIQYRRRAVRLMTNHPEQFRAKVEQARRLLRIMEQVLAAPPAVPKSGRPARRIRGPTRSALSD